MKCILVGPLPQQTLHSFSWKRLSWVKRLMRSSQRTFSTIPSAVMLSRLATLSSCFSMNSAVITKEGSLRIIPPLPLLFIFWLANSDVISSLDQRK